ncbi:MAG: hypothetical protein F6K22_12565, partial [Okeania sp. SIO2F4]|uniref:SdrD B-like domain-containing protein n=1 Tax=Okeania sp. SIO2F4 TaxID=2607790 RepID=UPI00142B6DF3
MSNLSEISNLLPNQVTVTSAISPNLLAGGSGVGDPSYFDLEIEDNDKGILDGAFDFFCIDTDLPLGFNAFDFNNNGVYGEENVLAPNVSEAFGLDPNTTFNEGDSRRFDASVYSSYDPAVTSDGLGGLIEKPENLDLVNWILNNTGTGNALEGYTAGEIQLAIWELMDNAPPSSEELRGVEAFLGFDQANVDEIIDLAQQHGEGFEPQEAGEKVAVILVPEGDLNGLGYGGQIIVTAVEISKFQGSIGDTIFRDDNGDGHQDTGEAGIENVTVELIDKGADGELGGGDDTVVATQTTDADGKYLFEELPTGNYAVKVTDENNALDGLVQTADPDSNLDNMSMVELAPGENNLDQDFGYDAPTGSIGDTIFRDDNADGNQDDGEAGISGVEVKLTDKGADGIFGTDDDVVIGTKTTDADGKYLFEDLEAGNYQVEVLNDNGALDGLDQTADPDSNLDNGSMVELDPGENDLEQDFGYDAPTGSIGDTIFRDDNADGNQDDGEAGISGVEVKLTDKGADGIFGT